MSSANPFWDFSLELYERDGVAEACIGLQDDADLDVNLLLYCIWAAIEGPGRLEDSELDRALSVAGAWQQQVVQPLRSARRAAGTLGGAGLFANACRRDIAATELGAERVEQWLLFDAFNERARQPPGDALEAACGNLAGYLRLAARDPAGCQARLAVLLQAAFPGGDVAGKWGHS